jgi:hypothetical protein
MSVNMGIGAGGTDAGGFNVSIGHEAAFSITSGAANVNLGFDAGWNTTTAQGNVFVGYGAASGVTTGGGNTIIGAVAGSTLATGNRNILISTCDPINLDQAADVPTPDTSNYLNIGNTIISGQNNICIGTAANLPAAELSNYLNIGNVIQGDMATPGSIIVSADPVIPLGIAAKQYVDTVAGGGGLPADLVNSIQFNDAGAFGGSANLSWDNTNNILSRGTLGSWNRILMNTTDTGVFDWQTAINMFGQGIEIDNAPNAPNIILVRARGTATAPETVQANDMVASYQGRAYDASLPTAWPVGGIDFWVDGTPTPGTNFPGKINFNTTPAGSPSVTRMTSGVALGLQMTVDFDYTMI